MGRQRTRKGTGSIYERGDRFVAQLTIAGTDGSQKRRTATFETRAEAEAWLLEQRTRRSEQAGPVSDQTVADYLRWWIDTEAPKGKPGRAPLAETTLTSYRSNIELHLIPAFGRKRVGELTVRDLDDFASAKLAEGLSPATINRMRETLRSALSTAVGQDRLSRNVARYGGGVGVDHGTLKTLRSTVATQLAEAGVHPKKAQAFLGHAHMSTTMKYYTAVGDISELADSLPDL